MSRLLGRITSDTRQGKIVQASREITTSIKYGSPNDSRLAVDVTVFYPLSKEPKVLVEIPANIELEVRKNGKGSNTLTWVEIDDLAEDIVGDTSGDMVEKESRAQLAVKMKNFIRRAAASGIEPEN